ncbi:hypothetical protein OG589_36850 [Sphaerisporangium sp. NBC_01403]|uniref:hypothetical protein n=1 Tax=Sphaerisporangium sp. NBC_01403 TaxID=2903599 RepID=UPI003251CCF0
MERPPARPVAPTASSRPDLFVVPSACTLPTAEQPLRIAEFDGLFASALRRVERPSPTCLRLHLDGAAEVERIARDLAARESTCCSFFGFTFTRDGEGLVLDVEVPPAQAVVLDGLAALAAPSARDGS